jgi:hypothetical protein
MLRPYNGDFPRSCHWAHQGLATFHESLHRSSEEWNYGGTYRLERLGIVPKREIRLPPIFTSLTRIL